MSPREKKKRFLLFLSRLKNFSFSGAGEVGSTALVPYLKCIHVQTCPAACFPQRDREERHTASLVTPVKPYFSCGPVSLLTLY